MDGLILALLAIPGIAVLIALSALVNGWALHLLWAWFVVPVFDAAPVLSIGQAIGVGMVVSFLTYQYMPKAEKSKTALWEGIVMVFSRPLFAVLLGLIIKQFV